MWDRRHADQTGVSWGNLALATGMMAWCAWYLVDAYTASSNTQNLIFIVPATVVTALVYLLIIGQELSRRRVSDSASLESASRRASEKSVVDEWMRPLALMGLLGLYVFLLPVIGFDVATFLLVAGGLMVLGERRPLFVVGYSVLFTGLVVGAFTFMLSLDMPTVLL